MYREKSDSTLRGSTAVFPTVSLHTNSTTVNSTVTGSQSPTIVPYDHLTVEPLFRVTGKREGDHTYKYENSSFCMNMKGLLK